MSRGLGWLERAAIAALIFGIRSHRGYATTDILLRLIHGRKVRPTRAQAISLRRALHSIGARLDARGYWSFTHDKTRERICIRSDDAQPGALQEPGYPVR
jgi:hypothetical protein